jgi:hypothetical protein
VCSRGLVKVAEHAGRAVKHKHAALLQGLVLQGSSSADAAAAAAAAAAGYELSRWLNTQAGPSNQNVPPCCSAWSCRHCLDTSTAAAAG